MQNSKKWFFKIYILRLRIIYWSQMSKKKFSVDDLEEASFEELEKTVFGEEEGRKNSSRNNSRPVTRK